MDAEKLKKALIEAKNVKIFKADEMFVR